MVCSDTLDVGALDVIALLSCGGGAAPQVQRCFTGTVCSLMPDPVPDMMQPSSASQTKHCLVSCMLPLLQLAFWAADPNNAAVESGRCLQYNLHLQHTHN
jgi:hypothetical protein